MHNIRAAMAYRGHKYTVQGSVEIDEKHTNREKLIVDDLRAMGYDIIYRVKEKPYRDDVSIFKIAWTGQKELK